MNAERKVERIRALLTNDGRGWDRSLEMLQEIEDIVTPRVFTVTCTITEADMDRALEDVENMDQLRARIAQEIQHKLNAEIDSALRATGGK